MYLQEDAVLVTRNLKDFGQLGIRLLNPFAFDLTGQHRAPPPPGEGLG